MYPDPALFVSDLEDANNNKKFSPNFFCLLLFEGTFTFFKDKKSKRSHKAVVIMIFSYYFCLVMDQVDPVDPDTDPSFSSEQ